MKIRTSMNRKGELGDIHIDVHLRGDGSRLGKTVISRISVLIKEMISANTEEELTRLSYVVLGYVICCGVSGFLDGESVDEATQCIACMAEKERRRFREEKNEDDSRKEKINDKD